MIQKYTQKFASNKGLLLIILFGFVIRMGFFVSLQPWNKEVVEKTILVIDALDYHQLALSFLNEKSFVGFDGFRTPVYPVFVALLLRISGNCVWFVLFIQIILNLLSVFLVFHIAIEIFSRRVATLSALLFAIDIHQALYAVTLCSDTLFVFLFLASVYYLCKSINRNAFPPIIISAIILGISSLERPVSFLIPFIVVCFILFISHLKLKMKLLYSIAFSVIFIATISPWIFRNYKTFGVAKLTTQSGSNLLFCNVASTEAYKTGKSIEQVRKEFKDLAIRQGVDTLDGNPFINSQIYSDIAQQYIKDNSILYCKRHFMGIINLYAGLATRHITSIFHLKSKPLNVGQEYGPNIILRIIDFFKSKSIGEISIAFGLSLYLLINYLTSFYAIFLLIRKKEKFVFLFILIILYFSAITGVIGLTRLRIPIMPFINILCAVGLFHFYDKILDKKSKVKAPLKTVRVNTRV